MLVRALLLLTLALPLPALAQLRWMEGRDFITMANGKPAEIRAGKIEVAEVFSYGCIFCYRAKDEITALQAALPADAYLTFVHASFAPAEAWPMFQRAWYAAQALGIGAATHHRMFAAVWETHEIKLLDPATNRIRSPLPTIRDAARFYARAAAVKEADFLKLANSPAIDAQMKRADAQVAAWRIPGTPSLVVNGRYLIEGKTMARASETRTLVLYLIGLERQRLARLKQPAIKP
ncbi:MAG: thiol:disulfide interchange protein DsbA/DsbL [Steroidobacteraceae bacterium]